MIINVTHRQDKASPAVREKIESWLEHAQERFDMITSAQVTLSKHDHLDEVEAILHAGGKEVTAKAEGQNLYAALDAVSQKIDRQLDKMHGKMVHKKGLPKKEAFLVEPESAVPDEEIELEGYEDIDELLEKVS